MILELSDQDNVALEEISKILERHPDLKLIEMVQQYAQQKERSGYVESPVVEENEFNGGRSRRILRNRRI